MSRPRAVLVAVLAAVLVAGMAMTLGSAWAARPSAPSASAPASASAGHLEHRAAAANEPLQGRVVVLDPGHQLGNHNFPEQTSRTVEAGGFRKPCNTTGTATNAGYPEATFNWQVSNLVRRRLESLGAKVVLTRDSNSEREWGPCVDERGRAGNRRPADLKVSIHGDGSYAAGARGFHVIYRYAASLELAKVVRARLRKASFTVANYVAGGDGLDRRSDLATLNLSEIPTVLVELGNMRSARDARVMSSRAGRVRYADALVAAVRVALR